MKILITASSNKDLEKAWGDYLFSRGHLIFRADTIKEFQSLKEESFDLCIPLIGENKYDDESIEIVDYVNCPLLNSYETMRIARNKYNCHQLFRNNSLKQIPTYTVEEFLDTKEDKNKEYIYKARISWKGEDVYKGTYNEINKLVDKEDYIVQEFMPDAITVRVIATPDKVITSYAKVASEGEFIASISKGAIRADYELTEADEKLAKDSVRVINGYIMGVDLLVSKGKTYLLETNEYFGWDWKNQELANKIMDAVETKII